MVVPSSQEPRVFIAAVPFEFSAPVYQYLAEHLSIRIPLEGDPLVLTADEALQILNQPTICRRSAQPHDWCSLGAAWRGIQGHRRQCKVPKQSRQATRSS